MKNILFISLVLIYSQLQAQTETITISNSTETLSIDKMCPVILTSRVNTTISGQIQSTTSVIIQPDHLHKIIIKPGYGTITKGEPGTGIKIGQGGSGGTIRPTITIVPNPVANNLHVTVEGTEITGYTIVDLSGNIRLQNSSISPTDEYDINVSGLPPGNYILIVDATSGEQPSAQFIKQ